MATSFFAYPGSPKTVSEPIRAALQLVSSHLRQKGYEGWEQNDIAGKFITDPIFSKIATCEFLAADITRLNFNVTFEIGFAIGLGRRILLTKNQAVHDDADLIRDVGIFDTLGYKQYSSSESLAAILTNVSDRLPPMLTSRELADSAPVYVVRPKIDTDLEVHLLSRIKKARLFFRSFDPNEQPRLSAQEAIKNVALSHGVIVPVLPQSRPDSAIHNIRAAFVAGLAKGMRKELLMLQFGDGPIPLDVLDEVKYATTDAQIERHLSDFAPAVTALLQSHKTRLVPDSSSFLAKLNLGAPAAENEFRDLAEYYIETDEYMRVARGEVQVVCGRKGSGKSALFFTVRAKKRSSKSHVVLDLRPESYQLQKFKDLVLAFMEQGTREHTVVAFWEYLLLLEICHKLLRDDRDSHTYNDVVFRAYRELEKTYKHDEFVSEGDFTERMLKLTDRITEDLKKAMTPGSATRLTGEELTNLLYRHDTRSLRDAVSQYVTSKREVWILFDNLDKGWPPYGLEDADVLILRCLVSALTKMEKYLGRRDTKCRGVVFLRNDVFELLVEGTVDRGKTSKVVLDWTDPALLAEMLRRRLTANGLNENSPFQEIWNEICASHVRSEDSASYLIERCLMRPRSLIELIYQCRSHAVNLRHARIELDDILEGEKAYSNDLIESIGLEMRDVFSECGDVRGLLYEFIGCPRFLSEDEVVGHLASGGIVAEMVPSVLQMLMWWGFLGVRRESGEVAYIYSVQYNIHRLKALLKKAAGTNVFHINPAFWAGLEISAE